MPEAKFREKLRRWRRDVRAAAVLAALIPVAYGVAVTFVWRPVHGVDVLLFCAGAGMALYVAVMGLAVPDRIYNWRRGADAERRTARRLASFARAGWIVEHSVAGRFADRDHIIFGPAGLFLVETKWRSGVITVEDGALVVSYPEEPDRHDARPLTRSLRARGRELEADIARTTRYRPCVRLVVVLWGEFPDGVIASDGVTFVAGPRLAAWLREQAPFPVPEWLVGPVAEAVRGLRSPVASAAEPRGRRWRWRHPMDRRTARRALPAARDDFS